MKYLLITSFIFLFSIHSNSALVGRSVKKGNTEFSGLAMKKNRRVALGTSFGGGLGTYGANLEINFTPRVGFLAGYGGGSGYRSFSFQIKNYLAGESILPFVGGGYAQWSGKNDPLKDASPSFLWEKFLSETEKNTGEFEKHILYPSVGIQYVNLDGEWAGFSIYGEVMLLMDIDEFESAASAALGMMFYF